MSHMSQAHLQAAPRPFRPTQPQASHSTPLSCPRLCSISCPLWEPRPVMTSDAHAPHVHTGAALDDPPRACPRGRAAVPRAGALVSRPHAATVRKGSGTEDSPAAPRGDQPAPFAVHVAPRQEVESIGAATAAATAAGSSEAFASVVVVVAEQQPPGPWQAQRRRLGSMLGSIAAKASGRGLAAGRRHRALRRASLRGLHQKCMHDRR